MLLERNAPKKEHRSEERFDIAARCKSDVNPLFKSDSDYLNFLLTRLEICISRKNVFLSYSRDL